MITIVDYGVGNLGSIINMFKRAGHPCILAQDKETLSKAEKILLPGVGAFDYGMNSLNKSNMRDTLEDLVLNKKLPTLGICLGSQMLGMSSEEGTEKGLGWIDMETKHFPNNNLRVPHMGWNIVIPQKTHSVFENMDRELRFYFVHSYFMCPKTEDSILASTIYGHPFTSMVIKDNIIGAQFHPEKSHRFGMELLNNFAKLC